MQMITDQRAIRSILRAPDVAPGFFREAGEVQDLPERVVFLQCEAGLFVLEPFPEFVAIHVATKADKRGAVAVRCAKQAIQWALNHYPVPRVITRIQNDRPEVKAFAVAAGMNRFMKDEHVTYYEVTR